MNPIEEAFRAGYKMAAGIKTETLEQAIELDRLTMIYLIDHSPGSLAKNGHPPVSRTRHK